MADIGALVVRLGADARELQQTFDQLQGDAKQFERGMANAGKIATAAFLSASAAAIALVRSGGEYAEMLSNISQKTGIATDELQGMQSILAQTGLSMDSLVTVNKKLSEQLVAAQNPNSQAAYKLAELGITATTTNGALSQLADKFAMMPDGANKTAIAVDLLGKSGQELIPVLNKGAAGFQESVNRSKELGAVLSGEALKALDQADTAFDDLGTATSALGHQMGALLAPAVTAVVSTMATGTGVAANFFGVLNSGSKSTDGILQSMEMVDSLLKKFGAPGFDVAGIKKSLDEQKKFADESKASAEAFYQAREEAGRKQEEIGERIIKNTQLQIYWLNKRREAFGQSIMQGEQSRGLQFAPADTSAFDALLEKIKALQRLMPELNTTEAAQLIAHNEDAAANTIRNSLAAYRDRNKELEVEYERYQGLANLQQEYYQNDSVFSDKAGAARRVAMGLIQAEYDLKRTLIDQEIFDETRKASAVQKLNDDTEAKRMAAVRQFPTFFEQQLNSVVASNAFSMGSIVNTWTSGIAQVILKGGNLKQAWEATQMAILQAGLNTLVQWGAQSALTFAKDLAMTTALQSAKVAATTSADAAIVASSAASAGATVTIWGAASTALVGMFASIGGAFTALATSLVTVVTVTGTFIMGVLSAIASALTATVFGIPYAGAILVGVGLIAAALAATKTVKFADGGIVTGPTNAMIGEAGSPEAVIPLNSRGSDFMQKAFGGGVGNGGKVEQVIMLDGRVLARSVSDNLPSVLRMSGVPA